MSIASMKQAAENTWGRRSLWVAALALLALLALTGSLTGCDQQRINELEEGLATEADVRSRFGEPQKVWDAIDMADVPGATAAAQAGARTLEYSRQPEGHVNYLITIGPDGKMSALRQTLTPENFARVTPGMSMEQVRKMLGRPMKVTPYALKQERHYDWRYRSTPNTSRIFTVVFDRDLRVVSTGSVDDVAPGGPNGPSGR